MKEQGLLHKMHPEWMTEYWFIACKSKELKRKPLPREIMGHRMVLFRRLDGTPGAIKDQCIHRNLSLSRARVCSSGLQCAYHGWTYDVDGRCTRIPAQTGPDKKEMRTRSWPVTESQGFVWVYMGKKKADASAVPAFPLHEDSRANTWMMERVFEGNALHCIENFLDIPHTIYVHSKWFRNESRKEIQFEVTAGKDHVCAEFFNEAQFDTLLGKLLIPANTVMKHTDQYFRPYTTRVDYYFSEKRQFIIQSHCVPINESRTRVFTWMAFRFDPIASLVRLVFEPMANRILDQDVKVIREQTEDINRAQQASFVFHRTDVIGKEIFDLANGKRLPSRIRKGTLAI